MIEPLKIAESDSEKKVTLIADSIYNTIRISSIEKEIISNDVFNRLHNILQNSTAYLTYPSLKTSRFSHSLGVMHIAGMIYQQGIVNARDEDRRRFFESGKKTIKNARIASFAKSQLSKYFEDNVGFHFRECNENLGNSLHFDALYAYTTPSSFSLEDYCNYNIIYQAVRIAALLHDLGHPPFSHMVENAFSEILHDLENEKREYKKLSNDEKNRFYELIIKFKGNESGKPKKIHEVLGNKLAEYVLSQTIKNFSNGDIKKAPQQVYDLIVISQIALGILNDGIQGDEDTENINFCRSLHSIISGEMDADRLDYMERDLRSSSNRGHISNERLLAGIYLVSSESEDKSYEIDKYVYEFIPSIQALSSIEEFFKKRFELYQFILYHHRVAKTDGLLTAAVTRLALEYLNNKSISERIKTGNNEPSDYLTPEIFWLWDVLDLKQNFYAWSVANKYFQWDDAWLLNCLRRKYIGLKEIIEKSKMEVDYHNNKKLIDADKFQVYPVLEELLTNKKKFISLYKRPVDFNEVDEAFIIEAIQDEDFDWKRMAPHDDKLTLSNEKSYKNILSYLNMCKFIRDDKAEELSYPFPQNFDELRICRGYFFNIILEYMIKMEFWSEYIKKDMVNKAIILVKRSEDLPFDDIDEIIPLFKVLKPGVSEGFHIIVDGQVKCLGNYSRIVQELNTASNLFPPFFVAIYKRGQAFSQIDLDRIKMNLGVSMWQVFKEMA